MLVQSIPPSLYCLKGNEPILLNNANQIWRIKSGALALFALYQGHRRFLFSVNADDVVFAIVPTPKAPGCQLLAIALQETVLEPFTQESFQHWMRLQPTRAIVALEGWITALSNSAATLSSPMIQTPIQGSGILDCNEVFQPPQGLLSWIRLYQGAANLMGQADLALTPSLGWFPISGALWLQATALVEMECCSYEAITHPDIFLNGLFQLQQRLWQWLAVQIQQDQQEELDRLYAREQINRDAITKTHQAFSNVFQPLKRQNGSLEPSAVKDLDAALLAAAGAVGRTLGITIQPPEASADRHRLRNPLDAIARASQVRMRRIQLRDDWWKKDCGPMLTYTSTDGRPVALLPVTEDTYELYDPLAQTRTRCDRAIASQLSTTAYTFYRALPNVLRPLDLLQFAIRGHLKELLVILAVGIATTMLGMVTPQATALLIERAIPDANRQLVWQMAFGLVAVAFGSTLFQMTQGLAIIRLETFADATTQAAVWDRLLKLQPSFFGQYKIGDLSSRVSAISQIRQRLGSTILKSLFAGIFSFLNLGLLFYYNASLALIAVLVAMINITVTIIAGKLTLKQTKPLLERQGKLLGVMVELINGVTKFRIAGAESRAFAYWGRQYSQQLTLMLGTQGIEDNLALINSLRTYALTEARRYGLNVS